MAHSKARATDGKVTYPPGVKEISDKISKEEMVRRLKVVKLLAKMFGAKDSELAAQNKPLWQCYLGRFNDIHVPIRLECVKFASHCLMNHPDLAKDLTASIYRKYSLQGEGGREASKQISWIKDKLLHIYYQNSIDDRLLVERVFAQYMVPFNLETTERMKCLYYLYATLDTNAVKALNEMWKCQNMLRNHVKDLLDLIKKPKVPLIDQHYRIPSADLLFLVCVSEACFLFLFFNLLQSEASSKAVFAKVMVITRNLPDPGKAQDFVKKLAQVLEDDERIRDQLETLIQGIKLMVRWLLGVKNNQSKSGNSTLRMLTAILHSDGDLTEQGRMGKPDMSRLRLAAACALLKLAQEPCYHEIITLEQYQLCALVINCYQVRQCFAQKLHRGLCRLRLPLEYMAVFALCAKDPVKERRAHARQCLVKNVNIRREYLKQHAAISGKEMKYCTFFTADFWFFLVIAVQSNAKSYIFSNASKYTFLNVVFY
ncbi:hypothetical protein GOODEAATRI_009343 [Goodea atripinnis]|uniref:PDS5 cohesin associated factor B n=1 Tax=Goodea atripinnis TaxID=208336 RepID=A0ABV0N9J0_9TELE